jgi:hypothetical protein
MGFALRSNYSPTLANSALTNTHLMPDVRLVLCLFTRDGLESLRTRPPRNQVEQVAANELVVLVNATVVRGTQGIAQGTRAVALSVFPGTFSPPSRVRQLAETILYALEERREFIVDQEGDFEDCDADLLISSLTSARDRPTGGNVIDADEEEEADDARFVQGIRVETVQDALRKLSRVNCKVPTGDFVPLSKRLVDRVLAGHTSAQSAPKSNDVGELDDASSRGGEATSTAATAATVSGASLLAQRDRCQQFVERWRTHFVDHTQPKFLPNGWSIKFQVEMNADG